MSDRFRCGGVAVLAAEGRLVGPRAEVHLRPKAMDLLVALARREGEVAGKRELLAEIWGGASVSEAVLTNAVTELRRALTAVGAARGVVANVPRRGYRLTAPVELEGPRPDAARSLAVLPFEDHSTGAPAGPLLAAIEEALIGELARQPALRVVPRLAVARFRPGATLLAEVGRALRVARLVTGSAVRNGTRLRLNAQLVDLAADRVLWSTSLVVALGDPLDLPLEVARLLAAELARALDLPALPARAERGAPLDPRSSELFLRGQLRLRGSTLESLEQGLADLDEVARRLPDLAAVHAGRARGLFLLASWNADPGGERRARAEAAAARALDLDPAVTEAHVWWTMTRAFGRWRIEDALWPLARLVRGHPHNPEARDALAHSLAALGRIDEAIEEEWRALADDPLSPALRAGLGFFLRCAGRLEEAAKVLAEAIELHPEWSIARLELGRVRWAQGEPALAAAEIARAVPEWGRFLAAIAGGRAGEVDLHLESWRIAPDTSPYWLAERAIWAAAPERALDALERALERGQLRVAYAGVDPTFTVLRDAPRFRALLRRLGLEAPPTV